MKKKLQEKIITILTDIYAINFHWYNYQFLTDCINARMLIRNLTSKDEYCDYLKEHKREQKSLVTGIFNATSSFFRDSYVFEVIQHLIMPEIVSVKPSIRVWSAGCANGEEAYSLAMIMAQSRIDEKTIKSSTIFASDVNLKKKINGSYHFSSGSLGETKLGSIKKFFFVNRNKYTVNTQILPRITFCSHDLTSGKTAFPVESVYGDFDLVLCRNVLIYLNSEGQERVLSNLYKSLNKKGYLILGRDELLVKSYIDKFATIDKYNKIFRRRG